MAAKNTWNCNSCLLKNLPFYNLDNSKLKLTLQGLSAEDTTGLKLLPSFTIQSLLDKIPGTFTIETDEFISDSTVSKYYKVDEFITSKISKNSFSILHLNIASLQGHIDDLKDLLSLLSHRFSESGITETRIKEGNEPLINIDINGYTLRGWGLNLYAGVWVYIILLQLL